jgi:hypothetical protein
MKALKAFALALVVGAAACSDPVGPNLNGPTRSITVSLCAALAPGVWFAYQNDGGPWTQATPNSNGQITFDATEKVSVATAISLFGISITEVVNATATELEATGSASCEGDFGDQTMSGTVAGVTGEQFARISGASSVDGVFAGTTAWALDELPSKPVDLIATRYATISTQPAERVVVRRGVTPNNTTVPVLDFGSAESGALESAVATFTNIPANGSLTMITAVQTASGTNAELGELTSTPGSATQAIGFVSLPASLRITSDMHVISASGSNATATNSIIHYYKAPTDKSLAFGPFVNMPTVTNVTTSPLVRPRIQLASQAEYPSATVVDFGESVGDEAHFVFILATAGYFGGTPATWDLTIPDMSSANYESAWGLSTTTYNWSVTAYGGVGAAWPFGPTVDGMTVTSSTRGKVDEIGLRKAALGRMPLRLLKRR